MKQYKTHRNKHPGHKDIEKLLSKTYLTHEFTISNSVFFQKILHLEKNWREFNTLTLYVQYFSFSLQVLLHPMTPQTHSFFKHSLFYIQLYV